MKKILPYLIVAIVCFGLGYGLATHVSVKALKAAEASYAAAAKADAETIASLKADNAKQEQTITAANATIATITANAGKPTPAEQAKDATIASLQSQVAAYKAKGDLAAALAESEAECQAWADKFTLAAVQHRTDISELNAAWQTKFDAKERERANWETAYDTEHQLRLDSESLTKSMMREVRATKVNHIADYIFEAGIGGYVGFKDKDWLPFGLCVVKEGLVWIIGKI